MSPAQSTGDPRAFRWRTALTTDTEPSISRPLLPREGLRAGFWGGKVPMMWRGGCGRAGGGVPHLSILGRPDLQPLCSSVLHLLIKDGVRNPCPALLASRRYCRCPRLRLLPGTQHAYPSPGEGRTEGLEKVPPRCHLYLCLRMDRV